MAQVVAPIAPFDAEHLFADLQLAYTACASVHYAGCPVVQEELIDSEREESMMLAQRFTVMVKSYARIRRSSSSESISSF